MTTKKDPKPTKQIKKTHKNKKHDWSYYAIITCVIIIAIPTLWLGITIVKASVGSGKPRFGARFDNDLEPRITDEQLSSIEKELTQLANVESVSVTTKTATVRILIDVVDTTTKEETLSITNEAYTHVTQVLPEKDYFTTSGPKKQYDLEINVYNRSAVTEETREGFVYYQLIKNGNMEKPDVQLVSEPRDPDFVETLKKQQERKDVQDGTDDKEESKTE